VEKEDPNKVYIWLKIEVKEFIFYLVACYFSPHGSNFYKMKKLDKEDPYATMKNDISVYNHKG